MCNHVTDFNARSKCLTANLNRAIGIIIFENDFLNFIVDTII